MVGSESIKNKFGTTLLEVSIVLLVLSTLMVGFIEFQMSMSSKSNRVKTINKLDVIQQAIGAYVLENQQLPCPAPLKLKSDDVNNGIETRNSLNSCTSNNLDGPFENSDGILFGAVPFKNLNLSIDYSFDAWRSKILYVVDKKYTEKTGFINNKGKYITIVDLGSDKDLNTLINAQTITNKAIYILFSTGQNSIGAFKENAQRAIRTNSVDSQNITSTNTFDNIFIKNATNDIFDDILVHSTRDELLEDIGWSDMPCGLNELVSLDSNWANTDNTRLQICGEDGTCEYANQYCNSEGMCDYGTIIPAYRPCPDGEITKSFNKFRLQMKQMVREHLAPVRKCLSFGKWSNVMYPCQPGCLPSTLTIAVDNYDSSVSPVLTINSANVTPYLNSILKRVGRGETITFECPADKSFVGTVTLECQTNGNWRVLSGVCKYLPEAIR